MTATVLATPVLALGLLHVLQKLEVWASQSAPPLPTPVIPATADHA